MPPPNRPRLRRVIARSTASRRFVAAAVAVALVAPLAACTTSTVVEGSEVVVAVDTPFTSLNPGTSYGRSSPANADVAWLTGSAFAAYDDAYRLVLDESFGTAEIVADEPLTVRYRVSADARWSDGTPVDAADLLLAWVADSGALNTPDFDDEPYVDPDTGRYTDDFPDDVVYFDGAVGAGLEHATALPELEDERTLVVAFDEFVPAWRTVLAPGIPAHVLQTLATGQDYEDAGSAKDAFVTAVTEGDTATLAALARTWNDAYNLDEGDDRTPEDGTLLVASGPYLVTAIDAAEVTLAANPQYRGDRRPTFETIRVRFVPDPLDAARLLESGAIDIVSPVATVDTADALLAVDGVSVTVGSEARVEHLDLQFADGRTGVFADERVRRAFLHVVPRQRILEEQVLPVQPDAVLLDSFVLRPGADGYADAVADNGSADYATTDVDAATRLLAEAGIPNPEVCVLYDPGNERRVAEFAALRESAARAGFAVTDCSSPDWRGLLGVAGAYDAALFAWDTTRLGPAAAGAVYRSDAALANYSRFADPEVDRLVDELVRADDPAEQARLSAAIDERLWAAGYGAPLYAYPSLTAVRETITGVTRSPLARGVFWNAWSWAPSE